MIDQQRSDDSPGDINVWPAVTDSILLIGSIFIVLAVVTLVTFVARLAPLRKGNINGESMLSLTYRIPAGLLFSSGSSTPHEQSTTIVDGILADIPARLGKVRRYAASQGWEDYYVVLEAAGHTDSDPVESTTFPGGDGNWDLSTMRANAVVHLIERRLKESPQLRERLNATLGRLDQQAPNGSTVLRASGYSSLLPAQQYGIAAGDALQSAKALNRRVEIRLYAEPARLLRTQFGAS